MTKRLHVFPEVTMNELPGLVWCPVEASTEQSGRSRKCRIGS